MTHSDTLRGILSLLLIAALAVQPLAAVSAGGLDACHDTTARHTAATGECGCCESAAEQDHGCCCKPSQPARTEAANNTSEEAAHAPMSATTGPPADYRRDQWQQGLLPAPCLCGSDSAPASHPAHRESRTSDPVPVDPIAQPTSLPAVDGRKQRGRYAPQHRQSSAAHFVQRHLCVWLI